MAPVDPEIGVKRENHSGPVNFRESNKTGVRQGHRPVAIPAHQSPQVRLLLLHGDRSANHSMLYQFKKAVHVAALTAEEKGSLRKNRLTCEERRPQPLPLLDGPLM